MKAIKCIFVFLMFLSFSSFVFAASYQMRVSHQLPETHIVAKNVQEFKKLLEEKTAGQIQVSIFPAAQAMPPKDSMKAVATGVIEAALVTNMEWAGLVPTMEVFLVPYLVTEISTIDRIFSGEVGKRLFKSLETKGVVPIMWLLQTRRNIYTSKDKFLLTPDDFKGKKMRGTSKIMNLSSEAMGAACVPIAGPEVVTALQTGIIDIGLTGPDAALVRHYYDFHKYGVIANNMSVVYTFFVSPKFWNSLPANLQKTVRDVALMVQKKNPKDSEDFALWAIDELKKKMNIHILSPEQEKQWKAVMQPPVMKYFLESTGKEGSELVSLIEKVGK